ncbi:N-terminal nucleophile aminohydrolases superfamily protein, partial [Prunus dulcis]
SAAKGVRRHGVDPNRSRNEEDMLSLSSPRQLLLSPPAATLRDLPPFPTSHRPPRLELISETGTKRTSTRRPTFPYHLRRCRGQNRPESAMEADGTEVQSACRRDRQGVEKCIGSTTGPLLTSTLQSQVKFWDWSKYRGDSAEFSAEV